ncbi:MAG TPA: ABC transporter [Clostridiales bacterium]|nr:ABC transporter [Clostridiales bacterium]
MSAPLVHIENLSVCYGQTPAVTGVSLDVAAGEYLGVIGPNGGGKSTLLKAILGLVPISSGTVRISGGEGGKSRPNIGYVPQLAEMEKKFPITLMEVVLTGRLRAGLKPFFRFSEKDREIASRLIERVGIGHLANRRISDLSGGEFQKMLIARALAAEPALMLLDEPTASVDAASQEQIYSLLAELNRHMTIILVTHDLMAVSSQVRSLACMNRSLVYHGEPELTENVVKSLYGCPVDLIAHGLPHRVLRHHGEEKHDDTGAV